MWRCNVAPVTILNKFYEFYRYDTHATNLRKGLLMNPWGKTQKKTVIYLNTTWIAQIATVFVEGDLYSSSDIYFVMLYDV